VKYNRPHLKSKQEKSQGERSIVFSSYQKMAKTNKKKRGPKKKGERKWRTRVISGEKENHLSASQEEESTTGKAYSG